MAQQPQPPWQYSGRLGGLFVYEPSTDSIILQRGQQFRRPAHVDPATLANASYERARPLSGNSINDGQCVQQSDQAVRGRGRGRGGGRGQSRGHGRGRGRGQGRVLAGNQGFNSHQNEHRQAERLESLRPQPSNVPTNQHQTPQMPPSLQGTVSNMQGMTLSAQGSSSQALSEQQRITGLTQGFDPNTHVQTLVQKSRPELVTPRELLAEGIYSRQRLIETQSGNAEKLDKSFFIRKSEFFSVGRVFKVLWAEPAGGNATVITNNTFKNHLGELVHSKVRWFVVVREGSYYCGALPIATYGGRGVAKPGVVKSEHGIIYTGRNIPSPYETERPTQPNEEGMRSDPIKVNPDSPLDRLDPKSRINFAAVHTVHHNIKVKSMGNVSQNSARILLQHFQNVWFVPRAGLSSTQYLRDQHRSPTGTMVSGRAGASLVSAADARGRAFATTVEDTNEEEEIENGNDEIEDKDAEGGAESDSSDDSEDELESEGNEV